MILTNSAAREISRSTCPDFKQNKENHVLTHLNALTAQGIIKQIPTYAHSGSTTSTRNGTPRNTKKSETIGPN